MGISSVTGTWTIGDNWPYPKLFFTDFWIMAVAVKGSALALYDMTNSGNTWTATEKVELGTAADIESVDVAGFERYAVITVSKGSTKQVYEKNYSTGAVTATAVGTIPGANSVCNYRGQLILGGLYSTGAPWDGLEACSVAWSDIGSTVVKPNEDVSAGFRQLPWDENANATIYKVLPLGDFVMIYGDNGVGMIKTQVVDKYPAMMFQDLRRAGAVGTYAVDGDEEQHLYLSKNNDLNLVTAKGVQKLGYRDFMSQLSGTIVITYDTSRKRFYISDGSLSFVYNGIGLYSTYQCVSSVGDYKGILCGFTKANADTRVRLTTTAFDGGVQGYKTLEAVESGLVYDSSSYSFEGSIYAKYDYGGSFVQTPWVALNKRGMFTQKLTGREFKISLRSTYDAGSEFQLSSLLGKLKFSDKTNIRGRLDVS